MRPGILDEILGQDHLLGKGKPLRRVIEKGELHSMIFWGPPGSGKTTLALAIARYTRARFVQFSAVTSGVQDIREVVKRAEFERRMHRRQTILFVDEIHRFNKAQQDAFLPHVESGRIVLIGATTENPSFEVIAPLLSRCRVYVLEQLEPGHLKALMNRALQSEQGLGGFKARVAEDAMDYIAMISQGDARSALTALELAVTAAEAEKTAGPHPQTAQAGPRTESHPQISQITQMGPGENLRNLRNLRMSSSADSAKSADRESGPTGLSPEPARVVTLDLVKDVIQRKFLLYDKAGEQHFNLISALHKCLRDSDPDGALYWLARMLEAGEDPLYVARRLVRFASEDIGLAQPNALLVASAAKDAVHFIGMPEGNTALAQAVVYLALAPKSNAVYRAYEQAKKDALETETEPVPLHLRNAPTGLMKGLGYGKGYKYAHDFPGAEVDQEHLPESLKGRRYYIPTDRGFEADLRKRQSRKPGES